MDTSELAAAVRTVTHMGDYFVDLKKSAFELVDQISAQDRGYFTPQEDEACRALLVSYWKSRSALFDLLTALRREQPSMDDRDQDVAFLTGYAAALLLVDAARCLREIVGARPVVRDKLNEPAPEFGIEERVYDRVQKSLLSSRHAWHLFHAIEYFRERETELRELGSEQQLKPVLAIIDRLEHRLEVSPGQFARAKLRTRADQIMRRMSSSVLGRAIYGMQKVGGSLVADKYLRLGHEPGLPGDVANEIRGRLLPGDVIVVRKEYALTNYFLPGFWPHAALYLGDAESLKQMGLQQHPNMQPHWEHLQSSSADEQPCVLESMKDGVHVRPLHSPFASDAAVVLRPQLTPGGVAEGLARALSHEAKPYDFSFDFSRSDRLVCTEVVYRAFDGIDKIELPLTRRAGRLTLSGGDLLAMGVARRHFETVLVYAPHHSSQIVTGPEADTLIREAEQLSSVDDGPDVTDEEGPA